ncbi:MAG: TIGR00341 family protein, partial [Microcystis sp. M49629_WE12]|nr:TIGR00341 family protein [Microcystis sp. M49629_WE12]
MTRKERPHSWFSRKPLTWQQSRTMWRDLWLEASLDFPYLALIVSSC